MSWIASERRARAGLRTRGNPVEPMVSLSHLSMKAGNPTALGRVQSWLDQIRLRHWAHFLVLPLATFDPSVLSRDTLLAVGRGVASAFSILAFGYLLNAISDRRMDLDSRKNAFIVHGAGAARYQLLGLAGVSLLLAWFSPWPAQLATVLCLTFGCIYSIGPRLKSIPIIGSVTNLVNFGPLLFVGMETAALPPGFTYVVLAFATLLLQNQLIHEAADAVEDRRGGLRTTWIVLGSHRTAALASVLGFVATAALTGLRSSPSSAFLAVSCGAAFGVSFPLLLARRGESPLRAVRLRVVHRWCAVFAGIALFWTWHWAGTSASAGGPG